MYQITWWVNMSDDATSVTREAATFDEALQLLPHGPAGWERYRIMEGERFVERGDPLGPRGMPAAERGN